MKSLSVEQVKAVLKAARENSSRDWCAFLLTFRHALRSQELRQLRLSDVDMSGLTLSIVRVKGSRSGVQSLDRHRGEPLLDEVLALRTWLKERVEDGSQVLFPSQKGGMMSRMQLLRLFKRYARAAVDLTGFQSPRECRRQQEMIDANAAVMFERLPEVVPEGELPLLVWV